MHELVGAHRIHMYAFISLNNTHLSVMATCSSIAEPVLVFQLPDIDVLLISVKNTN